MRRRRHYRRNPSLFGRKITTTQMVIYGVIGYFVYRQWYGGLAGFGSTALNPHVIHNLPWSWGGADYSWGAPPPFAHPATVYGTGSHLLQTTDLMLGQQTAHRAVATAVPTHPGAHFVRRMMGLGRINF